MPPDGIYLSNDRLQQLHGDLFEQDSRGVIADEWQRHATAALPDLVAQAQQQAEQQAQAQRDQLADQFTASIQADPALAAHLGGGPTPQESSQTAPTDAIAAPVAPAVPTTPDAAPAPPATATQPTPDAPVTAPMSPSSGWETVARAAAQKYGIDPDIFSRQIGQESGFNPAARSPAGAIGIAQFMPATAQGMGVDPSDPQQALDGAARLMASHLQTYGGDYGKALAAYNAGPGNVDKYGGVPPFEETQQYVSNILGSAGKAAAGAVQAVQTAVRDPGRILEAVKPFLGQPYVWGGKGPQQGFDCSGLAGYLTTGQPESTGTLYGKSSAVGQDQAQPGDLVFWNMGTSDPHLQHVGVYLGNGQVVQSGGDQAKVNIGNVEQAIGSPPEFRRLGPGGVPAQAAAAPAQTGMADQTAASTSAPQGILDRLQQIGPTIGSAISDAFSNLFGGGVAANRLPGQSGAPMFSQVPDITQPQPPTPAGVPTDPLGNLTDTVGGILNSKVPGTEAMLAGGTRQIQADLGGPPMTPAEQYALARGTATGLTQALVPEDLVARAATSGAGSLARSAEQAGQFAREESGALNLGGGPLAQPAAAIGEAANSLLAPLRNTPPQVQTVIRDFVGQMAEARGQADTLALRTKSLLGADDSREAAKLFEKTGEFVPNPTVEQSQHATDVAQFMQDTGDAGRQAGYIKGDVTAGGPGAPQFYFPHSYESGPTIPGSAAPSGISSKGGLNPKGSYSKGRTFGTLEEAQANGYQPVDSVSEPLRQYAANVLQSQAKAQVVARIKAIAPDAVIDYTPGAALPEGYKSGASVDPQLGSVALQEPIATALGNIINRGGGNAAGKAIMEAMGTAKEVMLSLSPFHLVTELRQAYRANNPQDAVPIIGKALWNMWSPNYDQFRLANADLYEQAMRAGVTQLEHAALSPDVGERLTGPAAMAVRGGTSAIFGGTGAYSETKREGGTDQQALQNALVSGTVLGAAGAVLARPMADSLFTRVIPTMKALTWGLKTAGGADPQAAATFVNQTFGGQNLQMIARAPGTQQFLRLAMLAPDWWEGWARQVGGAFNKGDVGTMGRGYWARTLAEAGFALEGLNYALTGHFTNGNGPNHQFDLETTSLTGATDPQSGVADRTYADVLGPLKNIAQLAASPLEQGGPANAIGTFAHNKAGLIPSTAATLMQNQDPSTHQAIVPPGTPAWKAAADVLESTLSRLSPITAAQTMRTNAEQGPGAAAVSAGLGLRLSAQSPDQEIANQKFQEKQARAEALQTNPPAPIREDVGRLYADHGIAILPPAATVPLGGRTAINVPITPAEQVQQRQFLNEALNRNVTQLLQDPSFTSAPRAAQERGLKTALSAAEREARGRLLDSIPSADLNQRADQASGSKQAPRAPIPASRIKP